MVETVDFLRLLERWVPFAETQIRACGNQEELQVYGQGAGNERAIHAHAMAFAVFAELAANSKTNLERTGTDRDSLWWHAFKMLRYLLRTHVSAEESATAGQAWGHSCGSAVILERMMHGVENLEIYLSDEDHDGLCRVLASECDWLAEHVKEESGKSLTEMEIASGCLLLRTSCLYPDLPKAEAYDHLGLELLRKALAQTETEVFISGAKGSMGTRLAMLAQVAMLHFSGRHFDWDLPEVLYRQMEALCELMVAGTFPDGNLIPICGASQEQWEHLQNLAPCAWMLLEERMEVKETAAWEQGWLRHVGLEQSDNVNGSFFSKSWDKVPLPVDQALHEAERAASLARCACWLRRFRPLSKESGESHEGKRRKQWNDHSSKTWLCQNQERMASWSWYAPEGPKGLCVPSWRSDMAPVTHNMTGWIQGQNRTSELSAQPVHGEAIEGGFVTSGRVVLQEGIKGPKQEQQAIAQTGIAFAALPDDKTVMILQRAVSLKKQQLSEISGLCMAVPNALDNGNLRHLESDTRGVEVLRRGEHSTEMLMAGKWLNVDGCLAVRSLDGQPMLLKRFEDEEMGVGLHFDQVCQGACLKDAIDCDRGEELFKVAVAIRVGLDGRQTAEWCQHTASASCKVVAKAPVLWGSVQGADGRNYVLIYNDDCNQQSVAVGDESFTLIQGDCRLIILPAE